MPFLASDSPRKAKNTNSNDPTIMFLDRDTVIRNQWTRLGPRRNMAILSRMAMVALLVSAAHASITSYQVPPLVAKARCVGSLSERSATRQTNALGQHQTTGVMELEKTVMTLRGGGESILCVSEVCAFSFTFFSGLKRTCDCAS
jgi:hypothetical protein